MQFSETSIQGLLVLEPTIFEDSRGYFFEPYNKGIFSDKGYKINFVQDNQAFSTYGVIRAFHYQLQPYAQAKLVRVLYGRILDVALDLRKNSPTFGKSFSIELSGSNKKQLFIPRGFAHGYSVLSETAEVFYKCDSLYNKESEGGVLYSDPSLNIDWQIPLDREIVSDKDKTFPLFITCKNNFAGIKWTQA